MNLLKYHYEPAAGYKAIVRPGDSGLRYIEFGILRLETHAAVTSDWGDREAFLVLLSGACAVDVRGEHVEMQRESVFCHRASSVYLPPGTCYRVQAMEVSEIAVALAPAAAAFPPRFLGPDDVGVTLQGGPHCKRYIHTIAGMDFPASRLLLGETYNLPGQWSSYPPHHHHVHGAKRVYAVEQIHYYLVDPPQGFGMQRLYSDDGSMDETHTVTNGDLAVVHGYHPVTAAPGYSLYYLWVRAGDVREVSTRSHPDHAWVEHLQASSSEEQSDSLSERRC